MSLDIHSLSIGAITGITISCVVVLLGMVLILFRLTNKMKLSQKKLKVSTAAPVINNSPTGYTRHLATADKSLVPMVSVLEGFHYNILISLFNRLLLLIYRSVAETTQQRKATFHCDPTNDVRNK